MIFIQRGKNFFYPFDKTAIKFVEAFPSSSGKRKCLTLEQYEVLKSIGLHPKIKPTLEELPTRKPKSPNNGETNDTGSRRNN